jgi:hypothetical protein
MLRTPTLNSLAPPPPPPASEPGKLPREMTARAGNHPNESGVKKERIEICLRRSPRRSVFFVSVCAGARVIENLDMRFSCRQIG